MNRTVAMAVVLAVKVALAAPALAEGDRDLPAAVLQAIDAGDWQAVSAALTDQARSPDATESELYWAGVAKFELTDWGAAIGFLDRALDLQPRSLPTARYLAKASRKHPGGGLAPMDNAVQLFPLDPVILAQAASLYRHYASFEDNEAYWDTALSYSARAVALAPDDPFAQATEADTIRTGGADERTINNLMAATALVPQNFQEYVWLGGMLEGVGLWESAAEAYMTAGEAGFGYGGDLRLRAGSTDAGKFSLRQKDVSPYTALRWAWEPFADRHRANLLVKLGRPQEAVEIFRRILNIHPATPWVRIEMAEAAWSAGDYATAIYMAKEAYNTDQAGDSGFDALELLARCALDMGQPKLALDFVDRAIAGAKAKAAGDGTGSAHDPIKPRWHLTRAIALWRLDQREVAAKAFLEAVRKSSDQPPYRGDRQAMEWAVYANKELNDYDAILDLIDLWAELGNARESLDLLKAVQPFVGMGARWQMEGKMADLLDQLGRPKMASLIVEHGYRKEGVGSYLDAWIALRAGKLQLAEDMFRQLALSRDSDSKYLGRLGLAVVALLGGEPDEALSRYETISDQLAELDKQMATTLRRWAGALAGDSSAIAQMTDFDLLGALSQPRVYGDLGWKIEAILPDSPLLTTNPPVRPDDLLLRINGSRITFPPPSESSDGGEVTVRLRRQDQIFDVDIDLDAVRQALHRKAELAGGGQ